MQQKLVDITDFLTKANNIVCAEAIETINGYYNYLQDVDYLVVTGGTGAAWFDMIKDFYKGLTSLTIINGTENENIPAIFANVRGYYMQQLNTLKKRK